VSPKKEDVPPHLNFAPLDNAVEALTRSSADYQKVFDRLNANGGAALASASLKDVNELLIQSERRLTTPEGLPGRFWYKHQLYAPGAYTGYAAKAIPAVRENLEQKKWKEAEQAAARVAQVLENEAALITSAAAKLSAATK
jgi:N-acetylated-alpha-linked acidic dipeptidase